MKIKFHHLIFLTFFLIIGSGCGSFTKMRYSRGFKSNIEFSLRNMTAKTEEHKASRAVKKGSTQLTAIPSENMPAFQDAVITRSADAMENLSQRSATEKSGYRSTSVKKPLFKIPAYIQKSNQRAEKHSGQPMEPNVLAASILFYGALALFGLFLLSLAAPATIFAFFNFLFVVLLMLVACITMAIIGVVLALVGLARIKESGNLYRGKWLAISILIFAAVLILLIAIG